MPESIRDVLPMLRSVSPIPKDAIARNPSTRDVILTELQKLPKPENGLLWFLRCLCLVTCLAPMLEIGDVMN